MTKDIYKKWEINNELESKIKKIYELTSKGVSLAKLARYLDISENTLTKLKKNHSDINEAYVSGKVEYESLLVGSLTKRALGFQVTDEDQYIEQTSTGTKKRIVKKIRNILPEPSVARYLLIINFGKEYSERKYELELKEKTLDSKNDEWTNIKDLDGNSNKED
jgi:chromosome segregation and condensation protein ScpB